MIRVTHMPANRRYSIILEHSGQVLLEQASLEQVEAFWDANDETYFGLRIEDAQSEHARVRHGRDSGRRRTRPALIACTAPLSRPA